MTLILRHGCRAVGAASGGGGGSRGFPYFTGGRRRRGFSHCFLPRVLLGGGRVLYVDGGNCFDPLLLARMARARGREPAEFYALVRVARAFTCFQLTELLVQAPRLLETFPASVLIVTAVPELYFDEDVREREARVSFRRALGALQALRKLPLATSVFTDATSFQTPRRTFFTQLIAQADCVSQFVERGSRLTLVSERAHFGFRNHLLKGEIFMGRTVPTFVQLIQNTIERWSEFRRALRREPGAFRPAVSLRARVHAGGDLSGAR